MECWTPNSELTLHVAESFLNKVLETYRVARPEEFRVVSANYPDGDPSATPMVLDSRGGHAMDYAVRIATAHIALPPVNELDWPILRPTEGQFGILIDLNAEFRDFAEPNARFLLKLRLWIVGELVRGTYSLGTYLTLHIADLAVRVIESNDLSYIEPRSLHDLIEFSTLNVIRHAAAGLRLPMTMNLSQVLRLKIFEHTIQNNEVELFGAAMVPPQE